MEHLLYAMIYGVVNMNDVIGNVNFLRPNDAYTHQETKTPLVQISEPMLEYC